MDYPLIQVTYFYFNHSREKAIVAIEQKDAKHSAMADYDALLRDLRLALEAVQPTQPDKDPEILQARSSLVALEQRYNAGRRDPFVRLDSFCVTRVLDCYSGDSAGELLLLTQVSKGWAEAVRVYLRLLESSDDITLMWQRTIRSEALRDLNQVLRRLINSSCHPYVSLPKPSTTAPVRDVHLCRELVQFHFSKYQRVFRLTIWLRYEKSKPPLAPLVCAHNYADKHISENGAAYYFDRWRPAAMLAPDGRCVQRKLDIEARRALDRFQSFSLLLCINTATRKFCLVPTVLDWSTELCIDQQSMKELSDAIQKLLLAGFWDL